MKIIEYECFKNCKKLSKLSIPSSISMIEQYAFALCSSLSKISIPSSLVTIKKYAFYGCSSLSDITCLEREHKNIFDYILDNYFKNDKSEQFFNLEKVAC